MDPPFPYWADHEHSDEHLNLLYVTHAQAIAPDHPSWANPDHDHDHDHDHSDEHLNMTYPSVRDQHHLFPPSPSLSPDSGYFSPPSEPHPRPGAKQLRVVNRTPTPPLTPPLFHPEQGNRNPSAWSVERESSSDRSVSEEASASGLRHRVSEEKTTKKKMKKKEEENRRGYSLSTSNEGESIFARGLRRARICVGKAIRGAEGNQHGRTTCGAERLDGAAGEEGGGWNGVGIGAGGGLRGEVFDKVKRMLMGRKGPVRLTRAKVRFPLD